MERFTSYVTTELGLDHPNGDASPTNYAAGTDRYALYKAGPILAVSVSGELYNIFLTICGITLSFFFNMLTKKMLFDMNLKSFDFRTCYVNRITLM